MKQKRDRSSRRGKQFLFPGENRGTGRQFSCSRTAAAYRPGKSGRRVPDCERAQKEPCEYPEPGTGA